MDAAFHQHARAAAHEGFGDFPFAIHSLCLGADAQCAGGVAEVDAVAFGAASGQVHERAGNGRRRADDDARDAERGVEELGWA